MFLIRGVVQVFTEDGVEVGIAFGDPACWENEDVVYGLMLGLGGTLTPLIEDSIVPGLGRVDSGALIDYLRGKTEATVILEPNENINTHCFVA